MKIGDILVAHHRLPMKIISLYKGVVTVKEIGTKMDTPMGSVEAIAHLISYDCEDIQKLIDKGILQIQPNLSPTQKEE